MSLPTDRENFKKEDEAFSNRDGSSDDSKDIGQDGKKKKRRTKKDSKPAEVLSDLKTSPRTSNRSKTRKSRNESKDAECAGGNSSSNSGKKNVGEVRDDIEQLKLNEEIVKDSQTKLLEPTGQFHTRPGISLESQPEVPASGMATSNENVKPPTEPDVPEDDLLQPSDDNSFRECVPPNTLNKPCGKEEVCQDRDPNFIHSPSKADLKRAAFAQNTENTLDDVSDITSDISDLQTDSSSGRQSVFHSARQDTPLDEIEESSVSVYKTVKSVLQDNEHSGAVPEEKKQELGMHQTPNKEVSDYKTAKDGDPTSQSSSGAKRDSVAQANVGEKDGWGKNYSSADEKISDEKVYLSEKDLLNKEIPNTEQLGREVHMEDRSGSGRQVGERAMGDLVEDQSESTENKSRKDSHKFSGCVNKKQHEGLSEPVLGAHCSDEQMDVDGVDPDNEGLEEHDGRLDMDESINDQDNSGGQGGSDEQRSGMEHVSDPDGSGRQGTSDDQSNMVDLEAAGGQEDLSGQENDDFENFAAGQFARYPVDSTTSPSDSGIDNSDSVFRRGDRPNEFDRYEVNEALHDNSEDTSSLAASGLAGLNNLQRWVGAGGNANEPEPVEQVESRNQPVELRERLNLNVPVDQHAPSTSSSNQPDWPGPSTVYLAKQEVLTIRMECAEHFASEIIGGNEGQGPTGQHVGANFESNPANLNLGARSTGEEGVLEQRSFSSGADLAKENIPDDVENGNANPDGDLPKKGRLPTTLGPKSSRRLDRDNSEQLSSSSKEHSREGSLADMDDAIDSSEYSKSEGNLQHSSDFKPASKVPKSDARPLIVGSTKQKVEKKRSQKRLAKVTPEKKLKKKRKDVNVPCRYEARSNADALRKTSSSEEES